MTRASSTRILLRAMMSALLIGTGRAGAQPPAPPPRPLQVWAIVVGVGDYANPAVPGVRTAAREAQLVRQWLQRAHWDARHQLLLSDGGSADHGRPSSPPARILPTRANLEWAFDRWLLDDGEKRTRPGDVVVFYFAGASRCTADRQGDQVGLRHHLLLRDSDLSKPETTGFPLESAIDRCIRNKLRVVCWLATAPEGPPGAPRSTGLEWLAHLARWPGVTAWLAADGPPRDPAADPGAVFTSALLAALGTPGASRRPNLASCLRDLHQDPRLARQGFRSLGGVPPELTLWPADLKPPAEPRPELVIQAGHADRVLAMAFPADGRLIATAALDSTIRIWSAPDRMLLRVLAGQTVGATALAITRDDRWLISGGGRGAVLIFDRANDFLGPVQIAGPRPHNEGIRQIAMLPDGLHFVSIDAEGVSFLWDPSRNPMAPKPFLKEKDVLCRRIAVGGRAAEGKDTGFVAALCSDKKVRVFDSTGGGGVIRQLARPGPEAVAVSPDGRLLAAGYRDGRVIVEDLQTGTRAEVPDAGRSTAYVPMELTFSPDGRLAVESGGGLSLIGPAGNGARRVVHLLDRPIRQIVFSPGGDAMAACTAEGHALRVWRLDGDNPPSVLLDDPSAGAFHIGFTGNGRGLLIADNIGGLEYRPMDPDGPDVPWAFPAHRGRVRQLSASPDRRFLLFLDDQTPSNAEDRSARNARIWDLQERTCRLLPGAHAAGAFLDKHRIVLVPDSNATEHAGRPILVELDRDGRPGDAAATFPDRADGFAVPEGVPFGRIAVSPDGKRLAATASASSEPMVCVWETVNRRLTHWITPEKLEDPVLALAFSDDGQYLATGGESEAARLWDLSAKPGELPAPAATFTDPSVTSMITCLAIRPGHADEVATGHRDGQVHYWKRAGDRGTLAVAGLVARAFSTDVKAMAFTPDGRYLAAAGDGRRIWVGSIEPQPRQVNRLEPRRMHHDEQINALIAWPGPAGPMLVSGSDDTTIRLWDLAAGKLRGTFSAGSRSSGPAALPAPEVDWVLYTPDGLYDASAEATKLVHYRRPRRLKPGAKSDADAGPQSTALAVGVSRQEEAGQLDQLAATHSVYGLGARLLRGLDPGQEPKAEEAPPIAIAAMRRNNPKDPQARLTITIGSDRLQDVRLYHNDVPIPLGWEPGMPATRPLEVPVRLVGGTNRFYAMASREGTYDSISRVVEVEYEAPMKRGRVHVVTLGVTAYPNRQLHYAKDDGEKIGEILNQRGIDDEKVRGLRRSLYEGAITPSSVEKAFRDIAREVEDRPQDTVVVFLAGHTGVFSPQRFCLLLPSYPFPEAKEPLSPTIQLAARDGGIAIDEREKILDPKSVLPYSMIEVNLARLKALNRLVIVDACQAELIDDDPKVRAVRKWMEVASRRARTSYLMAARRGEPALEASLLRHGLFTYALLGGMQAIGKDSVPEKVAELNLPPNADFDGDREISTDELDAYARQVLPRLAGIFRELLKVRGAVVADEKAAEVNARGPASKTSEQSLNLQAVEASFPLVPLDEAPAPR